MDIHFISAEAKTLHSFFVSMFYMLSTILLLIGVLLEYFKMPVGGSLSFPQLVGRTFIAAILLAAYPVKVAEVFRLIVEYRVSDYGLFGWLDKGQVFLPILLNSDAKETAIKIIHKLGAYGFNQFKTLLPPK